jgi:prefoldin subunit 5
MEITIIDHRLSQLKRELERGQQQLTLLEQRRQELRDTILRISGAIQVLEELQSQASAGNPQPVLAKSA